MLACVDDDVNQCNEPGLEAVGGVWSLRCATQGKNWRTIDTLQRIVP